MYKSGLQELSEFCNLTTTYYWRHCEQGRFGSNDNDGDDNADMSVLGIMNVHSFNLILSFVLKQNLEQISKDFKSLPSSMRFSFNQRLIKK